MWLFGVTVMRLKHGIFDFVRILFLSQFRFSRVSMCLIEMQQTPNARDNCYALLNMCAF